MKYIALGLSLSLTNICNPFYCLFQIFSWPKANDVMVNQQCQEKEGDEKKECENKVPETVAEMKELIRVLKEDQQRPPDPIGQILSKAAGKVVHKN